MELRYFELRVSRSGTQEGYDLFAISDRHGAGEAVSTIKPSAPPFETLSSLLERPLALQQLHELGTVLFERLFVGEAGEVLEDALREVLSDDDLALRIILRIEPPELAVLPLEMLFHPRRRLFLASAPKVSLSRTLTLGGPIRSMSLPPQARALLVVPDSGLDTAIERHETERLLRQVVTVDGVPAKVTRAALRAKLQETEYHLVHFSGHGDFRDGEARIFLDGERERPDPVPAQVFADLFLDYPAVRLILLNACRGAVRSKAAFAGLTLELMRRGVPAVIAMQSSITNSEATRFATTFYQSLVRGLHGGNVDFALALARQALLQDGFYNSQLVSPIFASPVLHLRSQESQLWRWDLPNLPEVWDAVRRHAERIRRNLDPLTLGRVSRPEVQKKYLPVLRRSLEERRSRIVALLGAAGFGKSTLLGEIYDILQTEGVPWILLIDCGELALAAGEDLDVTMGRAAGGGVEPITRLAFELTRRQGAGVVMIDTLDLVLHPAFVPHFQRVLSALGEADATVVFTCRDHDYDMVLGPPDRLKQVGNRIERFFVPPFRPEEIEQAAQAFVDRKVGQAGSPAGRSFAQKILGLSADSRPLRQITESPLLLAMLCDLFAEEVDVPRDLTVSQLYERYWKEKVVNSRRFAPEAPERVEKPRLCLQIAQKLLEQSEGHLQESIQEVDLDLASAPRAGARLELLSEGILKPHLLDSLRFFHQTFLEFAMARWLTTRAGAAARDRILAALGTHGERAPLHWWPVLRQLLVMVPEREFVQLLAAVPPDSSAAFRTVSLAAAIRSARPQLDDLLRHALRLGAEHQRYLCHAVESAPALEADLGWKIVLAILEDGQRKGALAAVQTAVALLGSAGSSLALRLRGVLDAIDARSARERNHDERAEIQGQLFQGCLPVLRQRGASDAELFDLLEERYLSFTEKIRCDVLRLFTAAPLPEARKIRFLESLLGHPSNGEVGEEVISLFLLRLRAEGAAERRSHEDTMAVLAAAVPRPWEGFYASAVGRLYAGEAGLVQAVLQDLFSPPPRIRYRDLMALEQVLQGGQPDLVRDALLAIPAESLSLAALRELAEVVRGISTYSADDSRLAVAEWLRPLVERWPEETVSLYSSVADASPAAWELLISTLDELMAAGKTKALKRAVVAVRPAAVHLLAPQIERFARLDSARSIYKQMLVELYRDSTDRPEAVLRLRDLALDKERPIAVMAVHSLVDAAGRGEHPAISELLPLLESPIPMVRESCFDVLLAIQGSRAEEIPTETLRLLSGVAARDTNPAVVQRYCKLLQEEIRRGADLSSEIVEATAGLAEELKGERGLGNKVARALIRVYKLIAQREVPAWAPLLERATLRFLEEINTNFLSNGETETLNLISALARVDPGVLGRLVEHGARFKPRNLRPVAIAIQRTQGKGSPLLARILAAEWCPPETRRVILDLQGI